MEQKFIKNFYGLFDYITPIPEPRTISGPFTNFYEGHVEYTGWGSGLNYDYWDCYCLRNGCDPPKTLEQLLINVEQPNKVRQWLDKYKFNMIYCFCDWCQGAIPRLIFGHIDPKNIQYTEEELDIVPEGLKIKADSSHHGFYVCPDETLIFINEPYY